MNEDYSGQQAINYYNIAWSWMNIDKVPILYVWKFTYNAFVLGEKLKYRSSKIVME